MNSEMAERIEGIAALFEARGLVRVGHPADDSIDLTDPARRRRVYLGTYLNPFSVGRAGDGLPLLWTDEWSDERPGVRIAPVYRHNGTAADVSVEVGYREWRGAVRVWRERWHWLRRDAEYARIVREQAPFYYLDEAEPVSSMECGRGRRIAKLGPAAGARAIGNAVEKALEAVATFRPDDWSRFARDPADYHRDTSADYYAAMKRRDAV